MLISSKINTNDLVYFRHKQKSLLFKLYQFAWKPRFGLARKHITEPAMKLFFFLKKNLYKKENFHVDVLYQGNWLPFQLETTDFQCAPVKGDTLNIEPELLFILKKLLPSNGVFFDVGANFGAVTLFATSAANFSGKVYSFEPFPPTFLNLQNIVNQIDKSSLINANHLALSNYCGTAKMQCSIEIHSGYATIKNETDHGVEVPVSTLDKFVQDSAIDKIDFIKLDVEDHELNVLEGAVDSLKKLRPIIYLENSKNLSVDTQLKIINLFNDADYSLFLPTWIYSSQDAWRTKAYSPEKNTDNALCLVDISNYSDVLTKRTYIYYVNLLAVPKEKIEYVRQQLL